MEVKFSEIIYSVKRARCEREWRVQTQNIQW